MTTSELFDRIQTWIWLDDQIPLPDSSNPTAQQIKLEVERQWDIGRLQNASELVVIKELTGTPAENDLNTAIQLAKSFDRTKLKDIYSLLLKVHKYMSQNHLT